MHGMKLKVRPGRNLGPADMSSLTLGWFLISRVLHAVEFRFKLAAATAVQSRLLNTRVDGQSKVKTAEQSAHLTGGRAGGGFLPPYPPRAAGWRPFWRLNSVRVRRLSI